MHGRNAPGKSTQPHVASCDDHRLATPVLYILQLYDGFVTPGSPVPLVALG
jgi:hypothetical protein